LGCPAEYLLDLDNIVQYPVVASVKFHQNLPAQRLNHRTAPFAKGLILPPGDKKVKSPEPTDISPQSGVPVRRIYSISPMFPPPYGDWLLAFGYFAVFLGLHSRQRLMGLFEK